MNSAQILSKVLSIIGIIFTALSLLSYYFIPTMPPPVLETDTLMNNDSGATLGLYEISTKPSKVYYSYAKIALVFFVISTVIIIHSPRSDYSLLLMKSLVNYVNAKIEYRSKEYLEWKKNLEKYSNNH